jgi:hypothetical protein
VNLDVSDEGLRTRRKRLLVYNDSTEARLALISETLAILLTLELEQREWARNPTRAVGAALGDFTCQTCGAKDFRGHVCPGEKIDE